MTKHTAIMRARRFTMTTTQTAPRVLDHLICTREHVAICSGMAFIIHKGDTAEVDTAYADGFDIVLGDECRYGGSTIEFLQLNMPEHWQAIDDELESIFDLIHDATDSAELKQHTEHAVESYLGAHPDASFKLIGLLDAAFADWIEATA